MIRNKTSFLIQSKHRQKGHKFTQNKDIMIHQPWWFEQYYQQKQQLTYINQNNRNITMLTSQYQVNPSVYTLKQVEKLITDNCQMIQNVDRWINTFKYSASGTAMYKNQKNLTNYLQKALSEQILTVFNNKQVISSVNNDLDHQASFSHSRVYNTLNQSFNNLTPNPLNTSYESQQQDRNRVFQQVNTKIQNLNIVMRRMNDVVMGQGDLVNRIDENLLVGKQNMVKANEQLDRRVRKQQGAGEFSLEGKVNKVITGLYVINLALILIFVLKHLIF